MENRQTSDLIKVAIALMDWALITLAFLLAYRLRFGSLAGVESFIWLYYFSVPMILLLLLKNGVLTGFRYRSLRQIFASAAAAFLVAGVLSTAILYLSRTADYSRLLFGTYFFLAMFFVLFEKVVVKKAFDKHLRGGGMNVRIALIGFGKKFEEIKQELNNRPQWGLKQVLEISPQGKDVDSIMAEIRIKIIDEAYVIFPRNFEYQEQLDALLTRLESFGLPVRVALNYDELQDYYGQHPCLLASQAGLLLAPHNLSPDQLIVKRSMDIMGGFTGLLLVLLLFPIVATLIKLDSKGPIFYSQLRIGKSGRFFRIYKFRSMCDDADAKKDGLRELNLHDGPLFKVDSDPRVTRVGRILRKYSIDEFPQFWNVFIGDMALVGSRPPTPDEVENYEEHHYRRISIRPGLTGLWQVSGRNQIRSFEDVVALDVKYIKQWSILGDIKIILRTIGAVMLPGRVRGM